MYAKYLHGNYNMLIVPFTLINKARVLTEGEKRMTDSVFGKNTIDYNKVLILKRTQFSDADTRAAAPFGQVTYPDSKFREDFSSPNASAYEKATFIHEMTHIWQHQLKYPIAKNGVVIQLKNELGGSVYTYTLSLTKKLKDYNMEQQGDIIADYYVLYHLVGTNSYLKQGLSSSAMPYTDPTKKSIYLTVLSDFLREPKNATKNLPINLSFSSLRGCC